MATDISNTTHHTPSDDLNNSFVSTKIQYTTKLLTSHYRLKYKNYVIKLKKKEEQSKSTVFFFFDYAFF